MSDLQCCTSAPPGLWSTVDSLGNFTEIDVQCIPKKKENKMRTETFVSAPITIEGAQQTDAGRDHLISRLYSIFHDRKFELDVAFLKEEHPKTYGEARAWVKKGNFRISISDDYKDSTAYNHYNWGFGWGTKEPDEEGYHKAFDKLKTARQVAEDIIMVKTDEDARLKALKDFESAKFH